MSDDLFDLFLGAFDYSTIADVPTCKRAAAKLDELRKNSPSARIFTPGQNVVGFLGERRFAMTALCPYRPRIYAVDGGDGGIDFTATWRNGWSATIAVTIDIKATDDRQRRHLLIPLKGFKTVTDIFVLTRIDRETGVGDLRGWAWRKEVMASPVETQVHGNDCYVVRELHDMIELWDRGDAFKQQIREGVAEVPY